MRALLIVAAGKSKRFGGFPKAFCKINNIRNIDNTINYAKLLFDKIFLVVNKETYKEFKNTVNNCEMFEIITGQGDAHSLLKAMNCIFTKYNYIKNLYVSWGDAYFFSAKPFYQFVTKIEEKNNINIAVACSNDKNPYAWFDVTENMKIIKSHFSREEGNIISGIHDQSLFYFNMDYAIKNLNKYREILNIPMNNSDNYEEKNEMKLLNFFEYMYKEKEPIDVILIDSGNISSFNTKEELNNFINEGN